MAAVIAVAGAHGWLIAARDGIGRGALPWTPARPFQLLISLAGSLGLPAADVAATLGMVAVAVVVVTVFDLSTRAEGSGATGALATVFMALSPVFARMVVEAPDVAAFTALVLLALWRAFGEIGSEGARSLSIVPWALVIGWGLEGALIFGAFLALRLLYARQYRLQRPDWIVILVWALLSIVLGVALLWLLGGWQGGPRSALEASGNAVMPMARLWTTTRALVWLPFALLFAVAWKTRAIWLLSGMAWAVIVPQLVLLALARPAGGGVLDAALAPLVPFLYILFALGLRSASQAITMGGLPGRQGVVVSAVFLAALAVTTAWPSISLLTGRAGTP